MFMVLRLEPPGVKPKGGLAAERGLAELGRFDPTTAVAEEATTTAELGRELVAEVGRVCAAAGRGRERAADCGLRRAGPTNRSAGDAGAVGPPTAAVADCGRWLGSGSTSETRPSSAAARCSLRRWISTRCDSISRSVVLSWATRSTMCSRSIEMSSLRARTELPLTSVPWGRPAAATAAAPPPPTPAMRPGMRPLRGRSTLEPAGPSVGTTTAPMALAAAAWA
mmetsp:Transcript_17435/g.57075  ORF Transcript_17435/g.57075 Transcript_17435/m.57075 type:complete len:224 (+) Transcript_17435:601-1272(+)